MGSYRVRLDLRQGVGVKVPPVTFVTPTTYGGRIIKLGGHIVATIIFATNKLNNEVVE